MDNEDIKADWEAIKNEYITDSSASYRSLAQKYGVVQRTLERKGKDEGWVNLRRQFTREVSAKTLEATAVMRAKQAEKITKIADKLLKKISQAVDELDIQIARDVHKTKTIEYRNDRRPDKPTKEVIDEKEVFSQVHSIVDRNGLRAIASALVDVQNALGIKTDLDDQEQRARIDALRARAGIKDDDDEDGEGGVIILADVEEAPGVDDDE